MKFYANEVVDHICLRYCWYVVLHIMSLLAHNEDRKYYRVHFIALQYLDGIYIFIVGYVYHTRNEKLTLCYKLEVMQNGVTLGIIWLWFQKAFVVGFFSFYRLLAYIPRIIATNPIAVRWKIVSLTGIMGFVIHIVHMIKFSHA